MIRARLEWAGASLRLVVVRKRVLLPFTVTDVPIEPYVGVYRHSVIGHHALMNALPDGGCDRLRCCWINEKDSGLEDQHYAWTEISATAVLVGGRRSDHKHLATLKCELPQGVVGRSVGCRIAVVVMQELQNLPKTIDKGHVIRNR